MEWKYFYRLSLKSLCLNSWKMTQIFKLSTKFLLNIYWQWSLNAIIQKSILLKYRYFAKWRVWKFDDCTKSIFLDFFNEYPFVDEKLWYKFGSVCYLQNNIKYVDNAFVESWENLRFHFYIISFLPQHTI